MGFVAMFSRDANLNQAIDGLGDRYEMLSNAYKPYPCGIVIHPAIDACRDIAEHLAPGAGAMTVKLTVNPLALTLTGRRSPATTIEAQISLYHWAAAVLLRRSAGPAELRPDCIADPGVVELRNRIEAVADPTLGRDAAIAAVTLADGSVRQSHVTNARGSAARPMTDEDLDAKFRVQANGVLALSSSNQLLRLCRGIESLPDVGRGIAAVLNG